LPKIKPEDVIVETALSVVQEAYEAFHRRDIPAFLELVGEDVDCDFIAPPDFAQTGRRRDKNQMLDFFQAIQKEDEFYTFRPREFIEAGEHVTVLGWLGATARAAREKHERAWVHVFTVRDKKIVDWRGFAHSTQ
jgi:ketosteroid isomerase-like protein